MLNYSFIHGLIIYLLEIFYCYLSLSFLGTMYLHSKPLFNTYPAPIKTIPCNGISCAPKAETVVNGQLYPFLPAGRCRALVHTTITRIRKTRMNKVYTNTNLK